MFAPVWLMRLSSASSTRRPTSAETSSAAPPEGRCSKLSDGRGGSSCCTATAGATDGRSCDAGGAPVAVLPSGTAASVTDACEVSVWLSSSASGMQPASCNAAAAPPPAAPAGFDGTTQRRPVWWAAGRCSPGAGGAASITAVICCRIFRQGLGFFPYKTKPLNLSTARLVVVVVATGSLLLLFCLPLHTNDDAAAADAACICQDTRCVL